MNDSPTTVCYRVITTVVHHVWPHAYRAIRRAIRRHAHHAIAAGTVIVCVAPPVVVLTVPPAPVAASAPRAAADVPEPAGVWVLGVGLLGVGIVRWRMRGE